MSEACYFCGVVTTSYSHVSAYEEMVELLVSMGVATAREIHQFMDTQDYGEAFRFGYADASDPVNTFCDHIDAGSYVQNQANYYMSLDQFNEDGVSAN